MTESTQYKYLSGLSERIPEPYRLFEEKYLQFQMPLLVSGKDRNGNQIDVPRIPASVANIIERRVHAPIEVRKAWQEFDFYTGDGSVAGINGDHLIVLDAKLLCEYTFESKLHKGALVLPDNVWDELKSQKDKVFYLSRSEVEEAQDKYYTKKGGVWTAQNKTVAKVWDILSRGCDLNTYLELAEERSMGHQLTFLRVSFNDTTTEGRSTMRSWTISSLYYNNVSGATSLEYDDLHNWPRVVGIAQNTLEQQVLNAIRNEKPFTYNGTEYTPQPIAEQYDDAALRAVARDDDPYATVRAGELQTAAAYHDVGKLRAP